MIKLEVSGNTSKKEQLKWTEIMDNAFIQAMITQQDKGNRINGTFTTQAYANMIEELTTKLPRDIIKMEITKNHLRNRLKTLKIRFSQWYDMFRGTSLSGFSWNPDTQLIEAEDEVWNKLIESKPEAASLKTKKVSNYNELLALFARDRASGIHAETAKEMNARLNNNDTINIETITDVDDLLATNEITLENEYNIEDDIQVLGEEIYKELAPMGLESHEIPKALNYLATNQAKARTLFSCPPEIRMDVLKDMMGADK
ncbi:uncharacterized protein At2g29880 isoform X2 [Helianthus annuus]|uniref:uncharacterized protein At2g29880-like isoform X2 n=1 Tax=Helianthus annuus TaxID=4232 RepID=UPI0016532CD2|nr:uncharacterized protein At2g29880-like isoform X2 [Helianthus annuus]XP_035836441.1 uncharacterized protein At2g29880-like isoform X2 [Helianthus annuus]XP_035844574.1 uncharacterized protein At2g29880 isoform X2 [Helianthus annuus]